MLACTTFELKQSTLEGEQTIWFKQNQSAVRIMVPKFPGSLTSSKARTKSACLSISLEAEISNIARIPCGVFRPLICSNCFLETTKERSLDSGGLKRRISSSEPKTPRHLIELPTNSSILLRPSTINWLYFCLNFFNWSARRCLICALLILSNIIKTKL